MSPLEFLTLARSLADATDSGPAGYRTAVSRAYYAAYLSGREMFNSLGLPLKLGALSEHQVVQRYLIHSQVLEAVELGHLLATLHECRKEADYELHNATYENRDESLLCVNRADEALRKVALCISEAAKVKAGVLQYRRAINA